MSKRATAWWSGLAAVALAFGDEQDAEPGKVEAEPAAATQEVEDGEMESHYELGMYAAFTVTE